MGFSEMGGCKECVQSKFQQADERAGIYADDHATLYERIISATRHHLPPIEHPHLTMQQS
jgi:hypothetical protein